MQSAQSMHILGVVPDMGPAQKVCTRQCLYLRGCIRREHRVKTRADLSAGAYVFRAMCPQIQTRINSLYKEAHASHLVDWRNSRQWSN